MSAARVSLMLVVCLTFVVGAGECPTREPLPDTLEPAALVLVPEDGQVTAEPGGDLDLAVQVLDTEGEGLDGARVFFLSPADGVFEFLAPAAAADTRDVVVATARGEVGGVSTAGLAAVRLRVGEDVPPGVAYVVVGVLWSPRDGAADDEAEGDGEADGDEGERPSYLLDVFRVTVADAAADATERSPR